MKLFVIYSTAALARRRFTGNVIFDLVAEIINDCLG